MDKNTHTIDSYNRYRIEDSDGDSIIVDATGTPSINTKEWVNITADDLRKAADWLDTQTSDATPDCEAATQTLEERILQALPNYDFGAGAGDLGLSLGCPASEIGEALGRLVIQKKVWRNRSSRLWSLRPPEPEPTTPDADKAEQPLADEILELLEDGGHTAQQMGNKLGCNIYEVRAACRQLKAYGKIHTSDWTVTDSWIYSLAPAAEPCPYEEAARLAQGLEEDPLSDYATKGLAHAVRLLAEAGTK